MGFVSQSPFIFDGTIEENLLYSCAAMLEGGGEEQKKLMPSLDDRIGILQQTGIFVDVLRFGLNTVLLHDQDDDLVSKIIRVRDRVAINRFGTYIINLRCYIPIRLYGKR